MPSREELIKLVDDGFLSALLVRTFGGTLHKSEGAKGDSDFILEFPHGRFPLGEQMATILIHEYRGIRGYESYTAGFYGWDKLMTIFFATTEDKNGRLQITISRPYPFKDHQSAMRVSCRMLE